MKRGFTQELVRETRNSGFNPLEGLRRVLADRRQALENERYGTAEQRRAAYGLMRGSFAQLFLNNPDKVGSSPGIAGGRQISLEWKGLGFAVLDKSEDDYSLHIVTDPFDFAETFLGERFRRKHNVIKLKSEQATATTWVTTCSRPPGSDSRAMPTLRESVHKTVLLAAEEASGLATLMNSDFIIPNFNSLPVAEDPEFKAWLKGTKA